MTAEETLNGRIYKLGEKPRRWPFHRLLATIWRVFGRKIAKRTPKLGSMAVLPQDLDTPTLNLIAQGEGQGIEFKRSLAELETGVRTVASMANADGGHVLFGVRKDGTILGVEIGTQTKERVVQAVATAETSASSAVPVMERFLTVPIGETRRYQWLVP